MEIIQTQYTKTAHRYGREAYQDGLPLDANPFSDDIAADSHESWQIGYREAESEEFAKVFNPKA